MTNFVTTLNFISGILNPILKMPFERYTDDCVSLKFNIEPLLPEGLYERITACYADVENLTNEDKCAMSWTFDCYAYLDVVTDEREPTYRNHLKVVCKCLQHKDLELAHVATDSTDGTEIVSKVLEEIEVRLKQLY